MLLRLCLLSSLLMIIGCGDVDPPTPPDAGRAGGPVVMVVDDGFDLSLPVFAEKIAGQYTIECRQDPGGAPPPDGGAAPNADGGAPGDGGPGASFDEVKAAFLAELGRPDDSCQLRPGISAKENPFADLESDRARWNEAMRTDRLVGSSSRPSSLDTLFEALIKRLEKARFHGTATAGIIAQSNPDTRLVLVERPLATAAQVSQSFTCLTQPAIDEAVALLSDPEVRAAYLARPVAAHDAALSEVMRTHGVHLVNQSFGRLSRFALEKLLDAQKCKPVSLRPFFAITGDLDRAYERAHPIPAALITKAAGNDGALVNGPEDHLDCRLDDPVTLTVGSYGLDYVRSTFSNFGACVDVYAPGSLVMSHLPGDWLFPLAGTSFAAPMVARLLATAFGRPFDPAAARSALLALRAPNKDIPVTRFPPELLYDPRPNLKSQALVVGEPRGEWMPSAPVLHHALWPVRWAERHIGRR